MSYCVHCGVELSSELNKCPLCNTVVIDPSAAEITGPIKYPYPAEIEGPRGSARRITATFFSLFLLIPLLSILIADLSINGGFTWSLIASGGILLFFMFFLFPNLFVRPLLWMFMIFDTLAAALYQFAICAVTHSDWWLMPGLPLTVLSGALVIGIYLIFSAKKPSISLKCIVFLLSVMVFSLCTQMIIDLYAHSVIKLSWSVYIAIGCTVISIIILVIERMYHLSDRIRKRIFL
ncbi:MAG: hypothetical protein IKK29_01650 [Christensenellaceae bacterium]|nr:hypothetical protein [Christensenellaceae bacterium]